MLRKIPADALLVLCVTCWGLNFTATKYAQQHGFTPLTFAAPRLTLAATLLVGIALARERSMRVGGSDLRRLLVIGLVVVFGNQLTFAFSFRFASAAVIALLFGTMPVIALLFSAALGLERIRTLQWAAAAVSFAGVGLVAGGAHGGTHSSVTGILLGLASPTTFVIYSIALAPLVRRHGTFKVNALSCVITLVPLIAVSMPALTTLHWGRVPALAWLCLVFSGTAYALPNLLWFAAVDRVGTARATLWANLQPFAGTVFAVLLLSERITALTFIGGGVLAAGIALSRLRRPVVAGVAPGEEPDLALAVVPPHE
jgi:drug/metabolite transporter (DMT)-like permease